MRAPAFCYWLQGLFELADPTELNEKQTQLIKEHLELVFKYDIDPSYPAEQQEQLNTAHNGHLNPVQAQKTRPSRNDRPDTVYLKC